MFARSQSFKFGARSLYRNYTVYSKNDQIYLHEFENRVAASFSKSPKDIVIGYSPTTKIDPERFEQNNDFLKLLNKSISDKVQNDFTYIMEAGNYGDSYMPIYDFREVPRFGRSPEVDSIFGYVRVNSEGKILPGSYERNDMYRLCNGAGLIKLSSYLLEQIQEAIQKN